MLSLVSMFLMIPTEVRGWGGGWSWRLESTWSRTRSNMGSRVWLRTLAEGVDKLILIRKRRRSGWDSINRSAGGGLPDFISFSSLLVRIRNILSHQVGPDVWRQMIEEESFEQETIILVHHVVQREQRANLPHQGGGFFVGSQGDT